jgi:hypothetical protein
MISQNETFYQVVPPEPAPAGSAEVPTRTAAR